MVKKINTHKKILNLVQKKYSNRKKIEQKLKLGIEMVLIMKKPG